MKLESINTNLPHRIQRYETLARICALVNITTVALVCIGIIAILTGPNFPPGALGVIWMQLNAPHLILISAAIGIIGVPLLLISDISLCIIFSLQKNAAIHDNISMTQIRNSSTSLVNFYRDDLNRRCLI